MDHGTSRERSSDPIRKRQYVTKSKAENSPREEQLAWIPPVKRQRKSKLVTRRTNRRVLPKGIRELHPIRREKRVKRVGISESNV